MGTRVTALGSNCSYLNAIFITVDANYMMLLLSFPSSRFTSRTQFLKFWPAHCAIRPAFFAAFSGKIVGRQGTAKLPTFERVLSMNKTFLIN